MSPHTGQIGQQCMMPKIQYPVRIKVPRHCPACSGQSRGTSGIVFIMSTSNNNKIVLIVLLDLRRPHHCCVCSVIKLSDVSRYPSPVDVSGRTLPSFLWIPAFFDPDGLAMTRWGCRESRGTKATTLALPLNINRGWPVKKDYGLPSGARRAEVKRQ